MMLDNFKIFMSHVSLGDDACKALFKLLSKLSVVENSEALKPSGLTPQACNTMMTEVKQVLMFHLKY